VATPTISTNPMTMNDIKTGRVFASPVFELFTI
jgi:hypothetical protein